MCVSVRAQMAALRFVCPRAEAQPGGVVSLFITCALSPVCLSGPEQQVLLLMGKGVVYGTPAGSIHIAGSWLHRQTLGPYPRPRN